MYFVTRADQRSAGSGGRLLQGIAVLAASLWAGLFTSRAYAVPGELRGGPELGATLTTRSSVAPSLGARLGYGLENNWELQLELTGMWLTVEDGQLATQLVPALAYRFDVVRWVPFVRVGAGPIVMWRDAAELGGLATAAGGLQYLWDRALAFDLTYQADFLVLRRESSVPLLPNHRIVFGVTWSSGW